LTTNAVLIDRFLPTLKAASIQKINVSLDTLRSERFQKITLKATFEAVQQNIDRLLQEGFELKLNVVLLKGVNDDEIIAFFNSHQGVTKAALFASNLKQTDFCRGEITIRWQQIIISSIASLQCLLSINLACKYIQHRNL